jgi:hypothetical protein
MNILKKYAGFLWISLGFVAIYLMLHQSNVEITKAVADNKAVLDTKMFWYIIIPIFTPIVAGLCIFGWYSIKGEYDK